jgi:hypothetical protein
MLQRNHDSLVTLQELAFVVGGRHFPGYSLRLDIFKTEKEGGISRRIGEVELQIVSICFSDVSAPVLQQGFGRKRFLCGTEEDFRRERRMIGLGYFALDTRTEGIGDAFFR